MSKSSTTQSLFFAVFTLALLVNPLLSRQDVKLAADESNDVWTETTTITSGKKYIISVVSGDNTYYLHPTSYSASPVATALDLTSAQHSYAWTFIGDNLLGYTITHDIGNRLYHRGVDTELRAAKDISVTNKLWLFSNNQLTCNGRYLAHYLTSSFNHWRSPSSSAVNNNGYNSAIVLYEYNETPLEAATTFAAFVNTGLGSGAKGKCDEYSRIILKYYSDLSIAAKTLLETSSEEGFSSAIARVNYLNLWRDHLSPLNEKQTKPINHNREVIVLSLLFSGLFVGFFFLKRKPQ